MFVVVKYANQPFEDHCIQTLQTTGYEISVIDNSEKKENLGAIWNREILRCKDDWICFINSDTVPPVGHRWIDRMISLVGKRLHSVNPTPWSNSVFAVGPMTNKCGIHYQVADGPVEGDPIEVETLSGFCIVFSVSYLRKLRCFREDFPFYGQESELLHWAKHRWGLALLACPDVYVKHIGHASIESKERFKTEKEYGRIRFSLSTKQDLKSTLIIGSVDSKFPFWRGLRQARRILNSNSSLADPMIDIKDINECTPEDILSVHRGKWDNIIFATSNVSLIKKNWGDLLELPRGWRAAIWCNDLRYPNETVGVDYAFLCYGANYFDPEKGMTAYDDWKARGITPVYMPQSSIVNTYVEPLDQNRSLVRDMANGYYNGDHDSVFIGSTGNNPYHWERNHILSNCYPNFSTRSVAVINRLIRSEREEVETLSKYVYRNFKFCLSMSPQVEGYTSIRTMNILAYGGLLLIRRFPGIDYFFENEKNCLMWDTIDELRSVMDGWRDRNEELEQIRISGWRLQQALHAVPYRLEQIMHHMDEMFEQGIAGGQK